MGRGSGLSTVSDEWRKRSLLVTAALLLRKGRGVLIEDENDRSGSQKIFKKDIF